MSVRAMVLMLALCAVGCHGPREVIPRAPAQRGLIYWPPMGEATPPALAEMGVQLTLENAEHVLVQLPWRPGGPDLSSMSRWMGNNARGGGKGLTIAVDWQEATRTELWRGGGEPWRWRDAGAAAAFIEAVRGTAAAYRPEYFVLGVEVNYYAHVQPADFRAFVEAYAQASEAVRQASPATRVLVTFQYEFITGRDRHWNVPADLDVVDAFGDDLDVVGIAVYPFLGGAEPGQVDAAYFEPIARLRKPVAVFETAWPSAPLWSEAMQAAYAERILSVADELGWPLVVWTVTTDTARLPEVAAGQPAFDAAAQWMRYLGLFTLDGEAKPAAEAWGRGVK